MATASDYTVCLKISKRLVKDFEKCELKENEGSFGI